MKLSRYQSAVLALACSAGFTHADVVTLKDGKKLEGNITSETPTHIHMRYRLTPKIWDDKDIPRSDIAEGGIVKQKPEEVEIIELRKYVPTPDLMSAEKYEQLIQDRLRPFLNRYPGTKEAAEVEKMMSDVLEEKEKVVGGGAKLEGKWLSREEAKAESLNIKAFTARSAMLEKIEAKDYSGALQEFDKFLDPKSGFAASMYYPKAAEEILAVMDKYEKQIEQMIREQPILQKTRDDNTKKLIEPELTRYKDAIALEKDKWKSNYDQERKTTKWFTPYKYDVDSLKTLSKSLAAQKETLKGLDLAVIAKVNECIARMLRADAKASKDKAELTKMGEAIVEGETAAANADATSKQFYRTVFTSYRERHAYFAQVLATAAPVEAQPAVTGAAGGSAAITGTATPGMDSKVAAALAAASGGAAATPAPAGTPGAVGTMPGAQPGVAPGVVPGAQPGVVPGVQPGVQPGVAPGVVPGAQPGVVPGVQPGMVPGAQPQPGMAPGYVPPQQQAMPVAAAPAAAEEEGMSTTNMILIAAGVVVLVILLTMLGGGKKKK